MRDCYQKKSVLTIELTLYTVGTWILMMTIIKVSTTAVGMESVTKTRFKAP